MRWRPFPSLDVVRPCDFPMHVLHTSIPCDIQGPRVHPISLTYVNHPSSRLASWLIPIHLFGDIVHLSSHIPLSIPLVSVEFAIVLGLCLTLLLPLQHNCVPSIFNHLGKQPFLLLRHTGGIVTTLGEMLWNTDGAITRGLSESGAQVWNASEARIKIAVHD